MLSIVCKSLPELSRGRTLTRCRVEARELWAHVTHSQTFAQGRGSCAYARCLAVILTVRRAGDW